MLEFTDLSVQAGERYAYRLVFEDAGVSTTTTEFWVQVPTGFALALQGFSPNPGSDPPQVSFALPTAGNATVEVLDVAGRRMAAETYAALSAGPHRVALRGTSLAPGLYLVCLRFGDRTLVTRGAVIR
jgi:hypothetical protein